MRFANAPRIVGASGLVLAIITAALAAGMTPAHAEALHTDADAAPSVAKAEMPARIITMSVGSGQLIRMPRPMDGVFVADEKIADVQVKGPTGLYVFAKGAGETTIFATDRSGAVVWSSKVRVGNNLADIGIMLRTAMPEADITVTPLSGMMILLTGTVLSPKDAADAEDLAQKFTAGTITVLNHLKVATPQQVNLQVKIAEVSRSVARNIGVNLANRDNSGGFLFGIGQGNAGTITSNTGTTPDPTTGAPAGSTIFTFNNVAGTTLGLAGRAFGMDLLSTLQLYESDGLVTTLAEPNLTALSGETASFLAGGEIPIPQSEGLGAVSVEFKQYGVSLSFTPTVLSSGRISMRVRPEVSQLSDSGSVKLNGFTIPSLTTRRAETTVELGSGQSFVIGGLLQNSHNNSTSKAPMLGDLPVLGALFRSNSFQKQETELMIVVTPYLVKPVDAKQIALPTDGYRSATTAQRVLLGKADDSVSSLDRPKPSASGNTPGPALK